MTAASLTERIASVARALSDEGDTKDTLEKSVALATEMIEGCDEVGVTLVHRHRSIETPVSTSDLAKRGDELQYELQEGPCLDAVWEHEMVLSPDLRHEDRWPAWGPRVVEELGVRSMLSFQLFTHEDALGALNLYSRRANAFTQDDCVEGLALAAQVAVALAGAQKVDSLNLALVRRATIGQAMGILMERFDINSDQAFAVLRRVSSHNNTKLHQIAVELVTTRTTPGVPTE